MWRRWSGARPGWGCVCAPSLAPSGAASFAPAAPRQSSAHGTEAAQAAGCPIHTASPRHSSVSPKDVIERRWQTERRWQSERKRWSKNNLTVPLGNKVEMSIERGWTLTQMWSPALEQESATESWPTCKLPRKSPPFLSVTNEDTWPAWYILEDEPDRPAEEE